MKVNFQKPNKILCIILAATICVCACVVSVSADDYSGLAGITQNDVNYIKQTLENAKKLVNGEITVHDAFYSQMTNATELVSENVKDINPFQSETELTGVTNRDYANKLTKSVRDCLSQHGGSVNQTEVTENLVDMRGYGARGELYDNSDSYLIVLCEYITYDGYNYRFYGSGGYIWSDKGVFNSSSWYADRAHLGTGSSFGPTNITNIIVYGDVRNTDGTPATDITQPTTGVIQTNDPSSLTDTQLIDLLQQMINQLKLDMPDLSTIDGLLAAILAQCQSINGKICTSSEIRSMLDDAISKINNGGGGMSDDDIEKITCALDNLKYENNNEQFISDLKDLIGMNGEYDEISKLEVVKSHFYEKAGFITELRNICDTAITAYMNSNNTVSFDFTYNGKSFNINFDFWEQYMPMFRFMLAAVIYLCFAWRTYRKIPSYISGGGDDN